MRQFNFKHTRFYNYVPPLVLVPGLILSGTVYVTFSVYEILKKNFLGTIYFNRAANFT